MSNKTLYHLTRPLQPYVSSAILTTFQGLQSHCLLWRVPGKCKPTLRPGSFFCLNVLISYFLFCFPLRLLHFIYFCYEVTASIPYQNLILYSIFHSTCICFYLSFSPLVDRESVCTIRCHHLSLAHSRHLFECISSCLVYVDLGSGLSAYDLSSISQCYSFCSGKKKTRFGGKEKILFVPKQQRWYLIVGN